MVTTVPSFFSFKHHGIKITDTLQLLQITTSALGNTNAMKIGLKSLYHSTLIMDSKAHNNERRNTHSEKRKQL